MQKKKKMERNYYIEAKVYSSELTIPNVYPKVNQAWHMTASKYGWKTLYFETKKEWDQAWDYMLEQGDEKVKPVNCGQIINGKKV